MPPKRKKPRRHKDRITILWNHVKHEVEALDEKVYYKSEAILKDLKNENLKPRIMTILLPESLSDLLDGMCPSDQGHHINSLVVHHIIGRVCRPTS